MAIKYIPYFPNTLEGQAVLDNFVRTKCILRYRDNDRVEERIKQGMPFYETELQERVGRNQNGNLVLRGECISACAYLKDKGITVDLVYIDPPFASGADYAKKVYLRRNPKVAEAIRQAESELDIEELIKNQVELVYFSFGNESEYFGYNDWDEKEPRENLTHEENQFISELRNDDMARILFKNQKWARQDYS